MKSAFSFCRRVLVDLFFLLVAYIAAVFLLPMLKATDRPTATPTSPFT